jgi:hypothetical protein
MTPSGYKGYPRRQLPAVFARGGMKVYAVLSVGAQLEGIFSTRLRAQAAIDEYKGDDTQTIAGAPYVICERDLDAMYIND